MVSVCLTSLFIFFVKQKTAYEMRISDWSSDVCSSDLAWHPLGRFEQLPKAVDSAALSHAAFADVARHAASNGWQADQLLIDVTSGFEGAQDLFAIARAEGVRPTLPVDRKSVVQGKRVAVRVDLGVRRSIQNNKTTQ